MNVNLTWISIIEVILNVRCDPLINEHIVKDNYRIKKEMNKSDE